MRQRYQWGTDAVCCCVKCESVCVCAFLNTRVHLHVCARLNNKWSLVITNCELYISLSNQNRVFTFDHIFSLSFLVLPPSLLLRCYHGNGRELSHWLRPSLSPELWFRCWNCQSASQICCRGGGDCVNIFWLTKMEGHLGGGRKGGGNLMLGREGGVRENVALDRISLLLCWSLESKHYYIQREGILTLNKIE